MKPEKCKGHIYRTTTQFTGTFELDVVKTNSGSQMSILCYIPYAADENKFALLYANSKITSFFIFFFSLLRCIKTSTSI